MAPKAKKRGKLVDTWRGTTRREMEENGAGEESNSNEENTIVDSLESDKEESEEEYDAQSKKFKLVYSVGGEGASTAGEKGGRECEEQENMIGKTDDKADGGNRPGHEEEHGSPIKGSKEAAIQGGTGNEGRDSTLSHGLEGHDNVESMQQHFKGIQENIQHAGGNGNDTAREVHNSPSQAAIGEDTYQDLDFDQVETVLGTMVAKFGGSPAKEIEFTQAEQSQSRIKSASASN